MNLYEEHKRFQKEEINTKNHVTLPRFVSSFHHVWRQDENIMLLLSAIALFTPDRLDRITSKEKKHFD